MAIKGLPGSESKKKNEIVQVRGLLDSMADQFRAALPRMISPERFIRTAMTTMQNNPRLAEYASANPFSLCGSMMEAAQLGLFPDNNLGHAWLIPRKIKGNPTVQFQPGYKGLVELARRSEQVSTVDRDVVHKSEWDAGTFKYSRGREVIFEHRFVLNRGLNEDGELEDPVLNSPDSNGKPHDPIVAAYATAHLRDGGFQAVVWPLAQVHQIRARSSSRKEGKITGPWITDYLAMVWKTMLIQLCKLIPSSIELQRAVVLDELSERGLDQKIALDPGLIEYLSKKGVETLTPEDEDDEEPEDVGGPPEAGSGKGAPKKGAAKGPPAV
jgi:recombination protein RecT